MSVELKYGFRSRSTGKLVRLEERYGESEEYGLEVDRYLTFDRRFPYFNEDINSVVSFRFGRELYGSNFMSLFMDRGMDLGDLEVVEYRTVASNESGRDPVRFSTEINPVEFNFVTGVRYQFPPSSGPRAKRLNAIFSKDEIAAMSDVSSVQLATLKSDTVDVASADLVGAVILPNYTIKHVTNAKPLGIVDQRTVDGVTYAAVAHHICNPRFFKVTGVDSALDADESPWDDLKVAFAFDDAEEGAEELLEEIWEEGEESGVWPEGWSLDETDAAGGRMVVVFRVTTPLAKADGQRVRAALDEISVLRDPRQRHEISATRRR
jgi:hypothetical protein